MDILVAFYKRIFKIWMIFPQKIRYLLVGGYNTLISYAIYCLVLMFFFPNNPQISLFLSFVLSSLNSFWTQKIFVFCSYGGKIFSEYMKCLMAWGISYLLNAVLLFLFLRIGLNPYVAQLTALVLVTINSYVLLKYVAFKVGGKKHAENSRFNPLL